MCKLTITNSIDCKYCDDYKTTEGTSPVLISYSTANVRQFH